MVLPSQHNRQESLPGLSDELESQSQQKISIAALTIMDSSAEQQWGTWSMQMTVWLEVS